MFLNIALILVFGSTSVLSYLSGYYVISTVVGAVTTLIIISYIDDAITRHSLNKTESTLPDEVHRLTDVLNDLKERHRKIERDYEERKKLIKDQVSVTLSAAGASEENISEVLGLLDLTQLFFGYAFSGNVLVDDVAAVKEILARLREIEEKGESCSAEEFNKFWEDLLDVIKNSVWYKNRAEGNRA